MKESGENVAVFKPIDEEPYAPNNPRGMKGLFGSATCRHGVKSGELTVREVAAYMLDHDGFAGVPATCLVELVHQEMPAKLFSVNDTMNRNYMQAISKLVPF